MSNIENLNRQYEKIKPIIKQRIKEFDTVWAFKNHLKIFHEFVFCLLTPQSKAKVAWKAVTELSQSGILYRGTQKDMEPYLKGVRFYRNKARYIEESRNKFFNNGYFSIIEMIDEHNIKKTRKLLVKTVKGYGYKEASHFLRNIGLYRDIAILDRHIMRNMVRFGYLDRIPDTLTPLKYLKIEERFMDFARDVSIPPEHLDLLLWYMEAGEVFK